LKSIIYVIGAGRSGTTLLDIILGNGSSIESCGELNRIPTLDGKPHNREAGSPQYAFWTSITDALSHDFPLAEQDTLHHRFEYHTGLLKTLLGQNSKSGKSKYYAYLTALFGKVFAGVPKPTIVDSSKYPGRALHLHYALRGVDIRFIYLVRDPVEVVRSFGKKDLEQPAKHWLAANAYYFVVNMLCRAVMRRLRKHHATIKVKYEDLANQPIETLKAIEAGLSIDLSAVRHKIDNDQPLLVGNLFDGNRIRLKESITLRKTNTTSEKNFKTQVTRMLNGAFYS